jgi:F5/8 type C domain-containing protein
VRAMLDAGLGWLSYRLFTELSVQDWHWNPAGSFSAGREGYWTSSASTGSARIADSFGYRLPHRGSTTDQGNNEDYSRLDDGDRRTYWKSDPYLTRAFTGEPDDRHPQWVVVDLGAAMPVDAVRIDWGQPYARSYAVQYWRGADAINDPGSGKWTTFPSGAAQRDGGGRTTLRLADAPIRVRFVRITMSRSSNTCDSHGSADRRNCVGYAIGELGVGTLDRRGGFVDLVRHARCGGEKPGRYACGERQTATYASSTDPWHAASNRVKNQEQPGLDLIARGGLTRGMPAMYPVPMLYSTPENAVAEVRYLEARGDPLSAIELGEEPDGQYAEPEDYAALYLQWAKALHAFDPALRLGGPVFSGVNSDLQWWPDARGDVSWLNRFLRYLRAHGRMRDLAFMTFEHYPFDGCEHGAALLHDLLIEPSLIKTVVHAWYADGIPRTMPLYITEANFSAVNYTEVPMQIEGALWLADYMATSLSNGVDGIVYYQYEPVPLSQNKQCPTDWGNLAMFAADGNAHIRARTAQFFAAKMLTQQWLAPGDAAHELYPVTTDVLRGRDPIVTAYAVRRPDRRWSVMLVNKDARAHDVRVRFADATTGRSSEFAGDVTRVTFGSAQYVWRRRGAASRPDPNEPPAISTIRGGAGTAYTIPAQSITVLRGDAS